MKVYVSTEGEYSDYRVLGVFSTLEAAAEIGDDVLEMELWDKVPPARVSFVIQHHPPYPASPQVQRFQLRPWDYSYESMNFGKRPAVERWGKAGIRVSGGVREAVLKAYFDRRAERMAVDDNIA